MAWSGLNSFKLRTLGSYPTSQVPGSESEQARQNLAVNYHLHYWGLKHTLALWLQGVLQPLTSQHFAPHTYLACIASL